MCLVYLCYAQESLLLFVTWSFCLTFTITSVFLPYFYFTSRIYYFYSNYFFWSPKILTFTFVTSAMSYFYFSYFFLGLSTFTFTSVTFFKIIKLYFLLQSILFPTSGLVKIVKISKLWLYFCSGRASWTKPNLRFSACQANKISVLLRPSSVLCLPKRMTESS